MNHDSKNLGGLEGRRLGHDMRCAIDLGKNRRELGWAPETRFKDGIAKTVRWYLEHRDGLQQILNGGYGDDTGR